MNGVRERECESMRARICKHERMCECVESEREGMR